MACEFFASSSIDEVERRRREYLKRLVEFRAAHPIRERGDVRALRLHFDDNFDDNFDEHADERKLVRWLQMYLMREPPLVHAFANGGWSEAEARTSRYEYLPKRLIRWFRPAAVKELSPLDLNSVAASMRRVIADPSETNASALERRARILPGVGTYTSRHLVRTLLLMIDSPHPSRDFLKMGGGADDSAYQRLRDVGIADVDSLNRECVRLGLLRSDERIDAGELAYLLCMSPCA